MNERGKKIDIRNDEPYCKLHIQAKSDKEEALMKNALLLDSSRRDIMLSFVTGLMVLEQIILVYWKSSFSSIVNPLPFGTSSPFCASCCYNSCAGDSSGDILAGNSFWRETVLIPYAR